MLAYEKYIVAIIICVASSSLVAGKDGPDTEMYVTEAT